MHLRLPILVAAALAALAGTVPVLTSQAPRKIDAKEMAAVEKIRARIEEKAKSTARASASPYDVTIPNSVVKFSMMAVPAGEFQMGSAAPDGKADEKPRHTVRLDAFWMQHAEVTWEAYLLFMFADQAKESGNPDPIVDALSRPTAPYVEMSFGRGLRGFPAISMTQHAANKFAEWLSAKTGEYYRLPTEAEWEYACRAGRASGEGPLDDYAWYSANSPNEAFPKGTYHRAGMKKPNAWGLHDMLGNVMEWTLDQYAPYTAAAQDNPWVPSTTPYPHAVRGGSWNDPAARVTCTARVASDPSWKKQDPQIPKSIWYLTDAQWLGFRVARPAKLPSAEEMYRAWNSGVEQDTY